MRKSSQADLERFLEELAATAQPGDRVPPIRDLMRRFGLSQVLVQRCFQHLKDRGLIASESGRGTYFLANAGSGSEGRAAGSASAHTGRARQQTARSILLLRRSISIMRGRVLVEALHRRFTSEGHRVLEVSYTDPEHARTVLRSLPRLDACVLQSSYKTVTIDLLAAIKERTDVLAIDGAALMGADVEVVGTEWGEPVARSVARLIEGGHTKIGYATVSTPFLANELGKRRFDSLKESRADLELYSVSVPHGPDSDYAEALVEELTSKLDGEGRLPFTAVVVWGIEDGSRFRSLLSARGIDVPGALSVVLLGRTDMSNEHGDFFEVFGCSVADQVDQLHAAIARRWAEPSAPFGIAFTPVTHRAGRSVGSPGFAPIKGVPPDA